MMLSENYVRAFTNHQALQPINLDALCKILDSCADYTRNLKTKGEKKMNLNKVIVIGRLGKDPEVKTLSSGQTLAKFSLAVSEQWIDREGNKQERTEWITCKVFGKQAESVGKYLSKGSVAYVEGKLETNSWEGEDGQKRFSTEVLAQRVQFGPKKSDGKPKNQASLGPEPSFDTGEELPF